MLRADLNGEKIAKAICAKHRTTDTRRSSEKGAQAPSPLTSSIKQRGTLLRSALFFSEKQRALIRSEQTEFACSPKGEKTVLRTVLREAREKQVRSPAPNNLLPRKLAENNYFKKITPQSRQNPFAEPFRWSKNIKNG